MFDSNRLKEFIEFYLRKTTVNSGQFDFEGSAFHEGKNKQKVAKS